MLIQKIYSDLPKGGVLATLYKSSAGKTKHLLASIGENAVMVVLSPLFFLLVLLYGILHPKRL